MYTQVKPFNVASAGTTKYLCLQNVRLGYGIGAYYGTATKAWNGTQQHADRNFPAGCSVPVFWSLFLTLDGKYEDYGHVAVRLADGRIWTDGRYYANVDELNSSYLGGKGKYLGWGESLNNVKVIGESMADTLTDDGSRQIGWHFLGRNGYDGKPNALSAKQTDLFGQPLTNAKLSEWFLSAEARDWRDVRLPKLYAERDALRVANGNLNTQVTQLTKAVAEKQKTIDSLNAQVLGLNQTINEKQAEIDTLADANADLKKENDELKAQLATCGDSEDTDFLNKLGEILRWLIARLGVKK